MLRSLQNLALALQKQEKQVTGYSRVGCSVRGNRTTEGKRLKKDNWQGRKLKFLVVWGSVRVGEGKGKQEGAETLRIWKA